MTGSVLEKFIFAVGVSVVAMLIVFAVLIILMFIIKFQNSIFEKRSAKNIEKEKPEDTVIVTKVEENEEVELQDDSEIVAAIIGALSLQLDVPTSGLNIRSIKRVSNSNWNNNSR
ncbi:OadG family protein [Clostridium senegalense]|uniref:OadG family protein n=1 Tax=Clostridium senegalense TaxID=1465809 RepID=A0A6M0H4K2_9CLOT|nr:OadG family protein [Clostridium senegalense]NEU05666.1 OadG family protein [Clostridium senegalense]